MPRELIATTPAGIRLVRNWDRRGLEIHFPGRPEREILEGLKVERWRWSPYARAWYKRFTVNALRNACAMLGLPEPAESTP